MTRNKILVSHSDLDGIGAIFIGWYYREKLGFDDFLSEDYGFEQDKDKMDLLKSYRTVVFADLSIPEEYHNQLIEAGVDVSYYDHHSSAEYLQGYDKMTFDLDKCGTMLFWEFYVKPRIKRFPPIVEEFVTLVDTYDIWRQESELWQTAKNLNSVLYGIRDYGSKSFFESYEPFFNLMTTKFKHFTHWRETDLERRLIERAEKREQDVYDKARETMSIRLDSKGKAFGVFAVPSKISLVASRILLEEPELDYLVIVNTWGGITGRLSFRSKNGFNCNSLGAANGHDCAAGGEILPDLAKEFLEDPSLAFTYEEDFDPENPRSVIEKVELEE